VLHTEHAAIRAGSGRGVQVSDEAIDADGRLPDVSGVPLSHMDMIQPSVLERALSAILAEGTTEPVAGFASSL